MKKLFITTTLVIFCFAFGNAQNKITVNVRNLKPISGELYVGLYNSKTSFLKEEYKSIKIKVDSNKVKVIFENIPNGTYAISTFHDANSNQKFDTYIFGIPKEGYAFSNNARGMFGPASFEDASFELNNEDINMTLNH